MAEHLQPGESYREVRLGPQTPPCSNTMAQGSKGALVEQAAARGLKEELGIEVEEAQLAGPLVQPHLRELHVPEVGVCDREFVTSFR